MYSSNVVLIILIMFIVLSFVYSKSKIEVKSNIDGRTYVVKNNYLSQKSADLLATINKNLLLLIDYVKKEHNNVSYIKNLENFNPDNIHENILNFDTTYTIDKGKLILFCIGPRNETISRLYEINTMMYVAIHELAHIVSDSIGHTDEFKRNFADLLKKAIKLGIYEYVDYSKEPTNYCGLNLTKNILGSKNTPT